ncbi:unnamed protein product [Mytilus coruscus]|uniref:B box-type domain-containing protein n=1 Tax=Mytilus coruscus TaxID=42192 RepID=A0A6J8AP00_MYTCO|nr:unnamed protein product [Mytilus coruscus]
MASSQSTGMAQTPTVCQFCEESPDIKWKCINCELFLCQLCSSKIHGKIKASMEHEIINITDFGIEDFATSVRKVELENMVCTIHVKQKCFVFCKDCSKPACSKCLNETHKMHDYKALDERYDEIISEMNELIKKFESNLQFFKNEKDKLQKVLSDGDNNFHETRDIILQTEKEMKEVISKHAKDLLQELDAKWKPLENKIKTELSEIKKIEEEWETKKKNLNQVLQSHQVEDIFTTSKTLEKPLPECWVKKIKPNKTKFIPRNMEVKKVGQSMLGDIYIVPEMELIHTFQSDVESVVALLLSSDNTAFIGNFANPEHSKLQTVKIETNNIKIERELQIQVFDMAWINDKEMLVSSRKCDFKLYTKDGQIKKFKSFTPLKTSCVYVTKDNKLIVGLTESSPITLPPPKDCIRRLVIMNQDGYVQHIIEYDKDNQRLLTFPHRVKTFHDKIIVVDVINKEFEGRVVMLDYGGQLHWTYNGCYSIHSDHVKLCAKDVAITSSEMILVTDSANHAIHILILLGKLLYVRM